MIQFNWIVGYELKTTLLFWREKVPGINGDPLGVIGWIKGELCGA